MASVLLVGNGINQAFSFASWESLVKKVRDKYKPDISWADLKYLPFTMQIVAASQNKVDKAMQDLSRDMNTKISLEQKDFLDRVLSLSIDNIVTTNYTFELEQAIIGKSRLYDYRKLRHYAKSCKGKEQQFGIFKYYSADESNKKIWHIHGDITKPSTVIMGTYYYGKVMREIQNYVSDFIKRYKTAQRKGAECAERSWIDSFLTKDVYILGFGLDISEIDLWWLIGCKKLHFPDTKIYYYEPKDNLPTAKIALLEAYNIIIDNEVEFKSNYRDYYYDVVNNIELKITNGGKTR